MRQLVQRSRRDATRVIYDILMQSANGVSRTHLIFRTNINHKLAKKYCVFLLKKHLLKLEADSDGTRYLLTERGERLLVLLREVEKELSEFYAMSLSTELVAQCRSARSRHDFGSERGRVPIEIQRAF